jgi:malate dehydrogenase (oxaloacetate-decarboxylating)
MEARPEDIVRWTRGQAIIATGSPAMRLNLMGAPFRLRNVITCIFPAIGLGAIASGATRITEAMLMAASCALADASPLVRNGEGALLPEIGTICDVTRSIAFEVGKAAQQSGVAEKISDEVCCRASTITFGYRTTVLINAGQFSHSSWNC